MKKKQIRRKQIRRIQIKVWPEITFQTPGLIPFDREPNSKLNPIDIDLSNTSEVDSSGLNVLLITLLKLSQKINDNEWNCLVPKSNELDELIRGLNFYHILISNFPNQNIFLRAEILNVPNSVPIEINSESLRRKLYPIYEINFIGQADRRIMVDEFKDYLIRTLFYLQADYDFDLNILIQILTEMAKNSADHTIGNAYFGLDISETKEKINLKFSFGDMGIGINQMIRHFIRDDTKFKDKAKHLAITDSYHYALDLGTTTKPDSGINKGIGMSTIFNMSKQLNFKLSVYDAESRGLLSDAINHSHKELRKAFYNIGFSVGFYYFGEIEIQKNDDISI